MAGICQHQTCYNHFRSWRLNMYWLFSETSYSNKRSFLLVNFFRDKISPNLWSFNSINFKRWFSAFVKILFHDFLSRISETIAIISDLAFGLTLTHIEPIFPFAPPSFPLTYGFLMISGGPKREHRLNMG